jgi:predicted membrane-bound mannosyltransferase
MAGADASLYPVKTPDREAHDVGTTTTRHTILGLERGTWLLLAIILAGAALRLFRLGEQSVWFDEASRLVMASSDLSSFLRNAAQDTQPPFFHLTQHFWLKVGTNAFLGRFLPAAMGILLLPWVYRLARELFD